MKRRQSSLSFRRAAKVLQPVFGSYENASEAIIRAIQASSIKMAAKTPSPYHPNPKFSQNSDVDQTWIVGEGGRTPSPAVLENLQDPELRDRWREYIYNGGMLLRRKELTNYLRPTTNQVLNGQMVHNVKKLVTKWNLAQVLAWVSTRSYHEVVQISCDDPWRSIAAAKVARPGYRYANSLDEAGIARLKTRQKHAQIRAVGWLRHVTATKHCGCGSAKFPEFEAWEKCSCLSEALEQIISSVDRKDLICLQREDSSLLERDIALSFKLEEFRLSSANGPGSILFSRSQTTDLFLPKGDKGGRPPSYNWSEFLEVATDKIRHRGGFGRGWMKADCVREMADWCSINWHKEPSEGMIKEKVDVAELMFKQNKSKH
ncbi:MAG: hypothetical protein ABJ360_07295 [Roseobacter sp.]|uniref:hypothetical protein n=1 Tax=Sphingomonadales TaxID=204457 RepID=UPI003265680C